jgi:hypothetical protein
MVDNMRGLTAPAGLAATLWANTADQEFAANGNIQINATGFSGGFIAGSTVIYIAIRRGPMKVPTTGTSVYNAIARSGTGADANITGVGFPPDLALIQTRNNGSYNPLAYDRLRGATNYLRTSLTAAEGTGSNTLKAFGMDGDTLGSANGVNATGETYINWFMQRAPSFMDVVCYTGSGTTNRTLDHGLTVVPELMIVKERSAVNKWCVYNSTIGYTKSLYLNTTDIPISTGDFQATPTSTTFSVTQLFNGLNNVSSNYVTYLFATCAGVSKVGSYTGNGSTQTINCGFGAGGARFVLIKRTDSTGDWYVYDTARGMTVLTDPYLFLNSGAAETATLGSVTTVSTGFALNSAIVAAINVNAGTYIFLAIA